ncbi:MAG: hypothetical protein COA79_22845 [Planctomycetota bacterium]|nr:MAG: hypothetical protein COA79_22845 [Planctomycetota bacterium]
MKSLFSSILFLLICQLFFSEKIYPNSPEDEMKIKREHVFKFSKKPVLSINGDVITIKFETVGYCDVTVAIEDHQGNIVRHLASGVLGKNAPKPFIKNSKKQSVLWDGKTDKGHYVKDIKLLNVRVSLGLKPIYEKSLNWDPKKRIGAGQGTGRGIAHKFPVPIFASAPEGVYIFEGHGVDQLRLFSYKGKYIKTIYPFPANKIKDVIGLKSFKTIPDNKVLPFKDGFQTSTLLTSGSNGQNNKYYRAMFGTAATAIAINKNFIALGMQKINRLATDGSSGGLPLTGVEIRRTVKLSSKNRKKDQINIKFPPISMAFSPDNKWLYLTGYLYRDGVPGRNLESGCLHGVWRVEYGKNYAPKLFLGKAGKKAFGNKNNEFNEATSVVVDKKGNLFIGDYKNNRVQVFNSSGKFIKSIKVSRPVKLFLDPKGNDLYIASWMLPHNSMTKSKPVPAVLNNYGTLKSPNKKFVCKLPFVKYKSKWSKNQYGALDHNITIDFYSKVKKLWVITNPKKTGREDIVGVGNKATGAWPMGNVKIYEINGNKLKLFNDFNKDVKANVGKIKPPYFWRQRLNVNPKSGKLYVFESNKTRWFKAAYEVTEVDPNTNKCKVIQLPFDAEDIGFDIDGFAYLRLQYMMARYDTSHTPWKEVPFDYGEERSEVGFSNTKSNGRRTDLISGLPIKFPYRSQWHNGGFMINAKGDIIISMLINKQFPHKLGSGSGSNEVYKPHVYPGRILLNDVHIFNKHGQLIRKDVMPGTTHLYGVALGKDGSVYGASHRARVMSDGKPFNKQTQTIFKFSKNSNAEILSEEGAAVELTNENRPKRRHDAYNSMGGRTWFKGSDWLYGGTGFSGKGAGKAGGGCSCWNSRFKLDYFDRVFAPEVNRFSVAVIDSNGNLILRIGQYGNVDSQGPNSRIPLGGDEVGLMHAQYLGVHSDKRLFIADAGNARIVSVKLEYHVNAKIKLDELKAK